MASTNVLPFAGISSSEIVKFIVSRKRLQRSIHKQALIQRIPESEHILKSTDTSPSSSDDMCYDAKQGVFNWERSNDSFFDGFFQYVYTGTYNAPAPEFVKSSPCEAYPTALPGISRPSGAYFNGQVVQLKKANETRRAVLLNLFHATYSGKVVDNWAVSYDSPLNDDTNQSYSTILYYHVSVHCYAEEYGLSELAILAKTNLYQTLAQFTLHTQGVADLVRVLELINGEANMTDTLCVSMIHHFVISHWHTLWEYRSFRRIAVDQNFYATELLCAGLDLSTW